ncbi:Uncharacterised protein [Streptococcus pneumoniae]|nr:Uncharacterised protein [Streptococcus pneumoniae]
MILIHKSVSFAPNLLEVDRSLLLGIRLLILGMLVHIHLASCSTQLAQFHQHLVLFYGSCHILLLLRGSLAQQSKHMLLSLILFLLHQVENHVKLIFLICLENRNQLSFLLQLALGVFRQLSLLQLLSRLLQYRFHPQHGLLAIRMLCNDLLHFQRMNDLNRHLMKYRLNRKAQQDDLIVNEQLMKMLQQKRPPLNLHHHK